MTDLIKARGPDIVKWTSAAEEAFTDLRTALYSNPVLVASDFEKELLLQMDASEVRLGAVLSQMLGEEEHPILFLSRLWLLMPLEAANPVSCRKSVRCKGEQSPRAVTTRAIPRVRRIRATALGPAGQHDWLVCMGGA